MSAIEESELDVYVRAALGRKARQLTILDVSDLTSVADVFIICSGRSHRQVTAIAQHIQTELKRQGIHPLHLEGKSQGHWALLDYGAVVIHVFYGPIRDFYDLEGLWADAPRITAPSLAAADSNDGPIEEPEDDLSL